MTAVVPGLVIRKDKKAFTKSDSQSWYFKPQLTSGGEVEAFILLTFIIITGRLINVNTYLRIFLKKNSKFLNFDIRAK